MKINLSNPNHKGSKLIFFTPFREGANGENQIVFIGIKVGIHKIYLFSGSFTATIYKDFETDPRISLVNMLKLF